VPVVRRTLLTAIAALVAGSLVACGGDDLSAPPATSTMTTGGAPYDGPTFACGTTNLRISYRVRYPREWFVNDPSSARPCGFFHPRPFTVPKATEVPQLAVQVRAEQVAFDRAAPPAEAGGPAEQVEERREMEIDGRRAVRVSATATGDALLPPGTKIVRYVVDGGEGVLIATTSELVRDVPFADAVAVLDAMATKLDVLSAGESLCSASAQPARPRRQARLPAAVMTTRQKIVEAASQCDYEGLASIAREGTGEFTYSFGPSGAPAQFWREAEGRGEPVLDVLVELLDRAFGTREVPGEPSLVVWPSAYGFESWDDVPAEDRAELRPIYGDDDFEQFDRAGAYLGHRVGITDGGDWTFYIAGD
jgi:hypothetical protein